MKSTLIPILLCLWFIPELGAAAAPKPPAPPAPENYCHDPATWAKLDGLLKQVPGDTLLIRSYALRIGICRLIDEGKVTLEQGIQIFDIERQRAIMERSQEETRRKKVKPVPLDDLEPRG